MTTKIATFEEAGIDRRILKAITEMGFETPMPVQQQVIPFLLHQTRDLVALAHTGTGKTAAFGLPIIQQIDPSDRLTQALILAPTRELCLQITDDLTRMAKYIDNLNIVPIYGGANIVTQIRQVGRGRTDCRGHAGPDARHAHPEKGECLSDSLAGPRTKPTKCSTWASRKNSTRCSQPPLRKSASCSFPPRCPAAWTPSHTAT